MSGYLCLPLYSCPANRFIYLCHFSRFHKCALIYGICFSLSNLFHSVWQTLGASTFLQMTQFHYFLWLSNTPLNTCITSLSIHLIIDYDGVGHFPPFYSYCVYICKYESSYGEILWDYAIILSLRKHAPTGVLILQSTIPSNTLFCFLLLLFSH